MSGDKWPKESQRMRNGASGQVPIAGVDRTADEDDYKNFNDSSHPGLNVELDFMWLESIARKQIGFGNSDHWSPSDRAAILAALVQMDCARTQAKAIRFAVKKIGDAIHGLSFAIASAIENASKSPPNDTTHNG